MQCRELADTQISYETYLKFLTGPYSMMLVVASIQHAEQLVEVRYPSILALYARLSLYALAPGLFRCQACISGAN